MSDKALFVFDYDGTLTTPIYTKEEGRIAVYPYGIDESAEFKNGYQHFTNHDSMYDIHRPIKPMQKIIEQIEKIDDFDTAVLSACHFGSQEAFEKVMFLNDNYGHAFSLKNFYGVPKSSQKADVLSLFIESDKYDAVYYVDDNLPNLVNIERTFLQKYTKQFVHNVCAEKYDDFDDDDIDMEKTRIDNLTTPILLTDKTPVRLRLFHTATFIELMSGSFEIPKDENLKKIFMCL